MVDINRLMVFLNASQTLNFSETAQHLHVSQPTVSKHIHDLEKELGVQLFTRSGGKMRLTDAGQSLLPWARKLVHLSSDMEKIARSIGNEVSGKINIACTTSAGRYILPQLAARFRQRFPQAQVNILACTQADAVSRLMDEETDVSVISTEVIEEDLEFQYFFTDYSVLIVAADHPWAHGQSIEPAELLEVPLFLREPTSGTRRTLLSALAAYDITLDDLNVFLEIGSAEGIIQAVAFGLGAGFVSRISAACALATRCVIEVPVSGLELQRKIWMARRRTLPPNRAREAFWTFVNDPEVADLLNLAEGKVDILTLSRMRSLNK